MKHWLTGIALIAITTAAQAENYRIVQSPSQKLDVWIDNIKDNTPQSWCANSLAVRIVANGDKNARVLNDFMPRLAALLENQCSKLQQVKWTLVDANDTRLAQGTAAKNKGWAVKVSTDAAQQPAWVLPSNLETLSPAADHSPWQAFALQDGCQLRSFWQGGANAPTLFIPATNAANCAQGAWVSGHSVMSQTSHGVEKKMTVTFVHGFPVVGLNEKVDPSQLLIVSVNNQRMVLSVEGAEKSWLILPYDASFNAWKTDGTLAVEVSRELLSDEAQLQVRIDKARQHWSSWLVSDVKLKVLPIDVLRPTLRDPAVGTWQAAK